MRAYLHAPATLLLGEKTPGAHEIGSWVSPIARLDASVKRKVSCLLHLHFTAHSQIALPAEVPWLPLDLQVDDIPLPFLITSAVSIRNFVIIGQVPNTRLECKYIMYFRCHISGCLVEHLQCLGTLVRSFILTSGKSHPRFRHNSFSLYNLKQYTLQNIEHLKGAVKFLGCLVKKYKGVGNCLYWTCACR